MKFSYNLLNEMLPGLPKPSVLEEIFADKFFEVEEIEEVKFPFKLEKIISAKVVSFEKHPNADRLLVVKLFDGKKNIEPVVCGAKNFAVGDIVALGLPGAVIPRNIHSKAGETFTLAKTDIRGVESQGMICAGFEIGLSDAPNSGVVILDQGTTLGVQIDKLLQPDTSLTLNLPANRPDLFSHLGIARALSGVLKIKLVPPKSLSLSKLKVTKGKVKNEVKDLVRANYFANVSNVQVKESTMQMLWKMKTVGQKTLNNIVDITNLVRVEVGEPTHAFDALKLNGNLSIRKAHKGEQLLTLDGKQKTLDSSMVVIADGKGAVSVGGSMGGDESKVSENTTDIIFEACNFDGAMVRLMTKHLGIKTDSSSIFEKKVHPLTAKLGIERALYLLQSQGCKIESVDEYLGAQYKPTLVKTTISEIEHYLGITLKATKVKNDLKACGFEAVITGDKITVTVPVFRSDVSGMADIAEEIIRMEGLNIASPNPLPKLPNTTIPRLGEYEKINRVKDIFVSLGFHEVVNYSFVSKTDVAKIGEDLKDFIAISNPESDNLSLLRRNLKIGQLNNVAINQHKVSGLKIFEVARVFYNFEDEPMHVGGCIFDKNLSAQQIFDLAKGTIQKLLESQGVKNYEFNVESENLVSISVGSKKWIGLVELVPVRVAKAFDIKYPTVLFGFNLDDIKTLITVPKFKPWSQFPKVRRDLSLILDKSVTWEKLSPAFESEAVIISVNEAKVLNDKFSAELDKNGKKNLIINLSLGKNDSTLTEAEIASEMDKIMLKLKHLGVEIR